MDVLPWINESVYIIVPVLFLLGMALKATPKIPDWLIPYILGGGGVLLCCGIMGVGSPAVIQGLLAAGASVYADQLGRQLSKRKEK